MTQVAPGIQRQFRRTEAQLSRLIQWTLQPDSLLLAHKTTVSKWTPAQHFEHLNLANAAILGGIRKLLEPGAQSEPVSDKARAFLDHGVIPRGTAKAPDFVLPQGRTLEEIREEAKALQQGYHDLKDRLDAVAQSQATSVHPVLGPLTAEQWLRFCEIHNFHHFEIVREMVGGNL